jgi:cell fate (sporulation/competence/biofilm development) regulator YlbF (YheA/YmcA/DUF963 family)
MDVIELAREIGKEIQKDDRYLKMQLAIQNTDKDTVLQDLIGQYNLKRMSLDTEVQKPESDQEKVQAFSQELRGLYAKIMENSSMTVYQQAKGELDHLLQRVQAIVTQSANGEDPETTDYVESSCGGDCSSCGGCH